MVRAVVMAVALFSLAGQCGGCGAVVGCGEDVVVVWMLE